MNRWRNRNDSEAPAQGKIKNSDEDISDSPQSRNSNDSSNHKSVMIPAMKQQTIKASIYGAQNGIPDDMQMSKRNQAVKKRVFLD